MPDATTLLSFRHLLEQNELGAPLFAKVGELLLVSGLKLSGSTIKARDTEMHQTKKGNQWYFGMKVHIGVDSRHGLTHSVRQRA